jgi:hypothetical protein
MLWLAIAILIGNMATAYGTDIQSSILNDGKHLVIVDGDLTKDDLQTFQRLVRAAPSGSTVALRSNGGAVATGMGMGTLIRMRGLITVVIDDMTCASACAIAWLAGTPRLMGRKARIGFHAASIGGAETGAGNALVGAYLERLGLPERAIFYGSGRCAPTAFDRMTA